MELLEQAKPHNPYVRRRDRRGLYYEHRAVAEWKLGRALRDGEVVHHCNGDKQDNHPENIWVFSTHRAHMLYEHYVLRQRQGVGHYPDYQHPFHQELGAMLKLAHL